MIRGYKEVKNATGIELVPVEKKKEKFEVGKAEKIHVRVEFISGFVSTGLFALVVFLLLSHDVISLREGYIFFWLYIVLRIVNVVANHKIRMNMLNDFLRQVRDMGEVIDEAFENAKAKEEKKRKRND